MRTKTTLKLKRYTSQNDRAFLTPVAKNHSQETYRFATLKVVSKTKEPKF